MSATPVPPPAPVRRERLPTSRLWWFTGPVMVLLLGVILLTAVKPVPYRALLPGSARSVGPLVTIKPVKGGPVPPKEDPHDSPLFVTVSVRTPTGLEALWRMRDKSVEIVPAEVITGGQSQKQNTQFNLQLMTDSKDKAKKVAMERAGYEVKVTPTGAVVTDLDPDLPVAEKIHPGDTIVEADGKPVTTTADVKTAIQAHRPGDTIVLKVEPFDGTPARTETVKISENPQKKGTPLLGVSLEDRPKYDFPLDVQIDSGQVGGPSAGLAFTLAILDRLTPGKLTGPEPVAVTGTIELDGTVGPVGGVVQKTEAAVREGAKLFIVPDDEYADAKRAARGRLEVRKVSNLDEALAVLRSVGGTPVVTKAD